MSAVNAPRDVSYADTIGKALTDPTEAAAYLEAVMQLKDSAALLLALNQIANAHTMTMHTPAHPGEVLKGWMSDMGTTAKAFAAHLGVQQARLSRVLNGRGAVSADMDLRLSEALGTTSGHWLTMQTQRDLWEASQKAKQRPKVKRIKLALAQANCNPAG